MLAKWALTINSLFLTWAVNARIWLDLECMIFLWMLELKESKRIGGGNQIAQTDFGFGTWTPKINKHLCGHQIKNDVGACKELFANFPCKLFKNHLCGHQFRNDVGTSVFDDLVGNGYPPKQESVRENKKLLKLFRWFRPLISELFGAISAKPESHNSAESS